MKEQIIEIEEAIRDAYWCMVAEVAHGKDTDRAMLTPNNLIEFLFSKQDQRQIVSPMSLPMSMNRCMGPAKPRSFSSQIASPDPYSPSAS